jgi:hypothetical protein
MQTQRDTTGMWYHRDPSGKLVNLKWYHRAIASIIFLIFCFFVLAALFTGSPQGWLMPIGFIGLVFGGMLLIRAYSEFKVAYKSKLSGSTVQPDVEASSLTNSADVDTPQYKFCSECGKQILRRAEICPLCGCRVSG